MARSGEAMIPAGPRVRARTGDTSLQGSRGAVTSDRNVRCGMVGHHGDQTCARTTTWTSTGRPGAEEAPTGLRRTRDLPSPDGSRARWRWCRQPHRVPRRPAADDQRLEHAGDLRPALRPRPGQARTHRPLTHSVIRPRGARDPRPGATLFRARRPLSRRPPAPRTPTRPARPTRSRAGRCDRGRMVQMIVARRDRRPGDSRCPGTS